MSRSAADVAIRCIDFSVARERADGGRVRAVDGVDFELRRGASLAVMGTVASGKSSLAAILAGDQDARVHHDGGDAWVDGVTVRARGRARRIRVFHTGYIPQGAGAALPARLTAEQSIASPVTSRSRHANPAGLAVRVAALLDELGMPLGVAAKYPYELSAGMRQRVAVARALMLAPRVLIADDAFAHLDARGRRLVAQALARRRDGAGMAMLLVGNDTAAAADLEAAVLVLRDGHVVAGGPDQGRLRWSPGTRRGVLAS